METVFILLLLISPLVGFILNLFLGKKIGKSVPGIIASLAVFISFLISLVYFLEIQSTKLIVSKHFFDWLVLGQFNIGFDIVLDQLSLLWLLIVTGIGTLIHIYSIGYMKDDQNVDRYFSYLNLFIFFMIILVTAGNLGLMFIGWEGVGLCSYLLIGFWYKNQNYNDAAKKAFIMNRIGDLGFLIGLFTLAFLFKTVDFTSMRIAVSTTNDLNSTNLLGLATLFLFVGAMGKSAQIPLYTWLPDAMAGPTPVSALIHAATMVTAGIFMITRLNFIFDLTPNVQLTIAIIGALTALFAATIGIVQNDIKKVLAYSTVSQLGLMFMAIGFGAYHIAVFHVITHAFFKACLFLGSGSVIHAMGGEQDMRKMGGLRKVMGITFFTFLISTLSISGIPPFAGFFSKDEILLSAFEHNTILWIVAAVASLLTALYMARVLFLTFWGEFRGTQNQKEHLHESPYSMTIPLIVLAVLATVGGFISLPFGFNWLNSYLQPVIQNLNGVEQHELGSTGIVLMIISTVIAIIGISIAYYKYVHKKQVPVDDKNITGFAKILYNKYYVDELYNVIFIKPIYKLADLFKNVIEKFIGKIVGAFGQTVDRLSMSFRIIQNGSLGFYLFAFVISFTILIFLLISI